MAVAKLRDLRERKKELTRIVGVLETLIQDWDLRLRKSNSRPAHLLESLPIGNPGGHLAPPFSSFRGRNPKREERR